MKIGTNSIGQKTPALHNKNRQLYPPNGEPIKNKTEWLKNYFTEVGFPRERSVETNEKIKNQPQPPQPTKEESEAADFNYVWGLVEDVEERDRTIHQLQTDLAEKEKRIASLQEQLKQATQKQPA